MEGYLARHEWFDPSDDIEGEGLGGAYSTGKIRGSTLHSVGAIWPSRSGCKAGLHLAVFLSIAFV